MFELHVTSSSISHNTCDPHPTDDQACHVFLTVFLQLSSLLHETSPGCHVNTTRASPDTRHVHASTPPHPISDQCVFILDQPIDNRACLFCLRLTRRGVNTLVRTYFSLPK